MSDDLYALWITEGRARAHARVLDSEKAAKLKNRDTQYAKSIAALAAINRRVAAVWDSAPDTFEELQAAQERL